SVIDRAKELLDTLEETGRKEFAHSPKSDQKPSSDASTSSPSLTAQRSLFGDAPQHAPSVDNSKLQSFIADIRALTLDATTPIQALNFLYKLQKKAKDL
ncbi:MAG: hypothetical protein KIG72_00765, partial [Bradymonadales bacterium]|nr:hypothetical protein [Bradymonadales bacterium]